MGLKCSFPAFCVKCSFPAAEEALRVNILQLLSASLVQLSCTSDADKSCKIGKLQTSFHFPNNCFVTPKPPCATTPLKNNDLENDVESISNNHATYMHIIGYHRFYLPCHHRFYLPCHCLYLSNDAQDMLDTNRVYQ